MKSCQNPRRNGQVDTFQQAPRKAVFDSAQSRKAYETTHDAVNGVVELQHYRLISGRSLKEHINHKLKP